MAYTIDTTHSSPNKSSRNGSAITMLVIHATVGSYASALRELTDPKPGHPKDRVSAHYLIRKDGFIAQLVPDAEAAWHAGVSQWFNLDSAAIQEQSLGIELENANTGRDSYPSAQLGALLWLCRQKVAQYRIVPDMVTRHLDIAMPRGRKTDPAGFPWAQFKTELYTPPPSPTGYRVRGLPIYQQQSLTGPIAGWLKSDELVQIDATYSNGAGHDALGRGFVDMDGVESV